jgi:hypothetical protein
VVILGLAPAMFADVTDYMLNINGTTYCPSFSAASCDSYGGFAAAGAGGTLDTTFGGTGLGTVTLTYNPGPGSYDVTLWLFEQLAIPGFNEYGAANGTPASNESWQIDVPDYDYNGSDPNFGGLPSGAGSIVGNTAGSSLADTNYVAGNNSQYSLSCSGDPTCNDFTSLALGFSFTLGADQKEVLSFDVTTAAPSGFSLEQIHPVDGSNSAETDYYFTGAANTESTVTGPVPEPGSILLLATVAGLLFAVFRSRSAAVRVK